MSVEADPFGVEHWIRVWADRRGRSVLAGLQARHPERWVAFYDTVAGVWAAMGGEPWRVGREVTRVLVANGVLEPGLSVLDIGCGPGGLTIPLAEAGAHVLAIDRSAGMVAEVARHAGERELPGVEARQADYQAVDLGVRVDLAAAAGFPPAWSPEGIARMEALATRHCVLVLGVGGDPFGLRTRVWRTVFGAPLPDPREMLVCAVNYLLASDRCPSVRSLEWPACLDVPLASVRFFFRAYLAMLGVDPVRAHEAIERAIEACRVGDRCRAEGVQRLAVVWWPV